MFKNFLIGLLFLFSTSFPSFAQELSLNQEGCDNYASVVTRMFLEFQGNPKLTADDLEKTVRPKDKKVYKKVPEDIKKLVKTSAEMLIKEGPNFNPMAIFELVQGFCYRHQGNIDEMIEVLNKALKKTEI